MSGGPTLTGSRWRPIAQLAAVVAAAFYVVGFVAGIARNDWNFLGALLVAPVLAAITGVLAVRLARREGQPDFALIVMVAFVAKMIGALARYYVAFVAYGGSADATGYDRYGRQLAPLYRHLDFGADVGKIPGTGFLRALTGVVYAITGTSRLGGFLVFSWFGLLGLLLFWRAFRIGVPDGDGRRYALLVLFLPSLLFWPSSIGKEAWMLVGLGVCAYGAARLFRGIGRGLGAFSLASGLAGVVLVRPHLGLIVLAGLVLGYAFNIARHRSVLAPVGWIVGLAVLAVTGVILVAQASSFLGVENLTQEAVDQKLTSVEQQTGQGGSEFDPVAVNNPLDVPGAAVTVLFRPFPFEAHSVFVAATSLEGVLLIGLCLVSWRRLRAIPAQMRGVAICRVQPRLRPGVRGGVLALRELRDPGEGASAGVAAAPRVPGAAGRRARRPEPACARHRRARRRLTCGRWTSGSGAAGVTGWLAPFAAVSAARPVVRAVDLSGRL